jgi:cytoskeletal protein RodZ
MGSIGETLRQARIDKGVSLAEAERATHIRRRYLEALEADDVATLPALVYTRGFIRTYSEYLGLSPHAMLDLYQPARARETGPRIRAAAPALTRPRELPVRTLVVVGAAALALVLLFYLWSQYHSFTESIRAAAQETPSLPSSVNKPTPSAVAGVSIGRTPVVDTPTPSPSVGPTVTPTPVTGVLVEAHVTDDTWMEAWVDGDPRLAENVKSGDTKTFHGEQRVRMRVANAAAVSVVVNGDPQPPLGSNGQVVDASWGRS